MKGIFKFTNGTHSYHGKHNSRGQRTLSKLYKGMPVCGNLKPLFDKIEQEREKQKEITKC